MMQILPTVFPIFLFIIGLIIMITCLRRISIQNYFKHFNKNIWIFIIFFGSIIGQLMYLAMEGDESN
ncbi:hypothetical protein CWR48_06240 [Oceanobacillus arenosus]|uniref:Cardiolipin synthase N-terminal domain-containing protein n=1 Tax=Oceanobacillus arenosus TaxID=1229153 RepID=A0A3D8PVX2_9BACI|nr:hypothetical protein [Oceanobacillus arenosus]RDW20286.1 hypothetical protein CWR48_06240 [Oceanobacillus arenosus]